jgi:hypothetical protein
MIGTGIKLTPLQYNRFAFGLDFTPMIGFQQSDFSTPYFLFPISMDFDFYFTKKFGISTDFGIGSSYRNGNQGAYFRGHFGLIWQLQSRRTIETNY